MSTPEYQRLWKLRKWSNKALLEAWHHDVRRQQEIEIILKERGVPTPAKEAGPDSACA